MGTERFAGIGKEGPSKPSSYVAKFELGDRRLDVLEYLEIAVAIGFDPGEVIRSLSDG